MKAAGSCAGDAYRLDSAVVCNLLRGINDEMP